MSRRPAARAPEAAAEVRILEAAASHIRRDGARRVALVRIAADLAMSHANIYRYFDDREALIDAVTAQWLKPAEAALRTIADGPDPAYDKLERMLSGLHRAYRDKLETDANLFALFAASVAEGRAVAKKHRLRVQSEIQRVVEEGVAGGVFAIGDQRRALALIYDGLHRFIHPISMEMDAEAARPGVQARMEGVLRLVLRALETGRA